MTLDNYAPLRAMSRTEKKLSNKPWITKGSVQFSFLLFLLRHMNKITKC